MKVVSDVFKARFKKLTKARKQKENQVLSNLDLAWEFSFGQKISKNSVVTVSSYVKWGKSKFELVKNINFKNIHHLPFWLLTFCCKIPAFNESCCNLWMRQIGTGIDIISHLCKKQILSILAFFTAYPKNLKVLCVFNCCECYDKLLICVWFWKLLPFF